jgi:hypothetical protein
MRPKSKLMLLATCGVVLYLLPAAPLKFAEHLIEVMALIHMSLEVLRKP